MSVKCIKEISILFKSVLIKGHLRETKRTKKEKKEMHAPDQHLFEFLCALSYLETIDSI